MTIDYEAVLPLPTCMSDEGCRSVIRHKDLPDGDLDPRQVSFEFIDNDFNITTTVWCIVPTILVLILLRPEYIMNKTIANLIIAFL